MIELSFHKELYDGRAIDQAAKLYDRFGTIARDEEAHRWILRVEAKDPAKELRLARELANYALGLTVEKRAAG